MGFLKINEVKRKAYGDLVGLGEPLKEQSSSKGKGVSSDSPNKLGLFNQGSSKAYAGPLSIREKKSWQDLEQLQHILEAPNLKKGINQISF